MVHFVSMRCVIDTLDYVTEMVDEGYPVDEIFLDFRKAFDKVSHERLLYKLEHMGVKGTILLWLSNFLNERKQRVKVNGSYSCWAEVTSGVPQGSVLGPLLFVAYINDLPSKLLSQCNLFADDSKIYNIVDNALNIQKLQDDINKCSEWADEWKMEFHPHKCKVLHFGSKNTENEYVIGNNKIMPANYEKDLGVTISDDLKWTEHIKICANKANRMIGLIRRTFSYIDQEMFLMLYKTFIRPLVEYCPEVWNPHLEKNINVLEKVQRRATKLVSDLRNVPYEERLIRLKLFPLKDRRLRGDMITTFKLLNGLIDVDANRLVPLLDSTVSQINTRSHNQQIKCKVPRSNLRRYFFTNRIVLSWNTLSRDTVNSPSVEVFKDRYDRERLGAYL